MSEKEEKKTTKEDTTKKNTSPPKRKSRSKKKKVTYVHIDEYLGRKANDIEEDIKLGFKVYMRGRTYMHSHKDFDKALKEFMNREI